MESASNSTASSEFFKASVSLQNVQFSFQSPENQISGMMDDFISNLVKNRDNMSFLFFVPVIYSVL